VTTGTPDNTHPVIHEILAAADLLRERATKAVHQNRTAWSTTATLGTRSPVVTDHPNSPSVLIETFAGRLEDVNDYLATVNPSVGLLMADWLHFHAVHTARLYELVEGASERVDVSHPAVLLARKILGIAEAYDHPEPLTVDREVI
jgi:hypothetical protein